MQRRPLLIITLALFCALAWIAGSDAWLRRDADRRAQALAESVAELFQGAGRPLRVEDAFVRLARTSGIDQAELWRGQAQLAAFGQARSPLLGAPLRAELPLRGPDPSLRLVLRQYSWRWWWNFFSLLVFGSLAWGLAWAQRQAQALAALQAGRLKQEESGHASAAEALRQRLQMQEELRGILDALREAPAVLADRAMNTALESLGRLAGADRAFIFLFQDDGRRFGYTHGWAAPGLREGAMEGMESLPSETFAWWLEELRQHGSLKAGDLDELPAEASAERYLLGLRQVKSFLAVPLKTGGKTLGFCGYSRVRLAAPFRPRDEELLRAAAGGISGLLARSRGELRAQRLFATEQLLSGTARSFVDSEPGDLDEALGRALEQLGRFCQAERCSLALTQGDGMRLVIFQAWSAPGIAEGPQDGRNLAAAGLPDLLRGLRGPGRWAAPSVDGLGLEAEAERVELGRRDAKAALAVALRQGTHLQGFLLMERLSTGAFSPDAGDAASALADILASALRRQQAEAALRASEERARALLSGVPDALLRFTRTGRILDARLPKGDRFFLGELLGKDMEKLPAHVPGLAPGAVPALKAAMATSLRTGQPQTLDLRLGEEAGNARFMEARVIPIAEEEALLLLRDRTQERRRDQEHERQLGNLLAIFNAGSRGLFLLDRDGRLQAFNQVAQQKTRASLGFSLQTGARLADLVHPSKVPGFQRQFDRALLGEEPEVEGDYPLPDGTAWRVRAHFLPVFGEDGSVRAVCLSLEYLDRLQQAEAALQESEERYILAAKGANDGLWDLDLRRHSLFVSPRWEAQAGLAEGQGPKTLEAWLDLALPEDRQALQERLNAHLEGRTDHFEAEYRLRHQERGDHRWVLARGLAVRDAEGKAVRAAGSQTDIHLAKSREGSLLKDALQDPLTGLPNRALVLDRLGRCLARAKRRKGYAFALLFLDTDNFKAVNQSLGHAAGDALLKELAARLETALRPGDTVGRLGGDEFAVLLDDLTKKDDALLVAKRILQDCEKPFVVMGREVFATVSVGIAISQEDLSAPGVLLRDAETAMVQAKAQGRSRLVVFEPGMHQAAVSRMDLESGLRKALSEGQFRLHYQPIVRIADGELLGFEALARWMHPERGMILPGEFIPAAEESGLILPLGRLVLSQGLQALADWGKEGRALKLSVNLSPRQLEDPDLLRELDDALKATGVKPQRLQLEVTEGVLMSNRQGATRALEALRSRGLSIAIDDFGTGYSSLSYLHQFPVETLKIDRAFVSRMDGLPVNEAVTSAVISLGRNLGLQLVAEGIETEMQARRLKALGCQAGQGYWYAKPLPEAEARAAIGRRFPVPDAP